MGARREPLTPLRQAVEEAYSQFKAEPPGRWSGDDMGLGEEDWARLTNVPLRELNRHDTYHFLSETFRFNRREVCYMLPRLLELLAEAEAPNAAGEECSLSCLAEAGYPDVWTTPERAVVETFFEAMLDECLTEQGFWDRLSLDTLLCMAGNANADIGALLDRAERADDKWIARAVAFDLDWIGGPHSSGGLVNAFWESAKPKHRSAVEAWYRRPELLERIERAFFAETDPEWQRRISKAVEVMGTWQRTSVGRG